MVPHFLSAAVRSCSALTSWAIAFWLALESSICGIGFSCGVGKCSERVEGGGLIAAQFA